MFADADDVFTCLLTCFTSPAKRVSSFPLWALPDIVPLYFGIGLVMVPPPFPHLTLKSLHLQLVM